MGPLAIANHLLSFVAPALFLAAVLALCGPLIVRGTAPRGRAVAFTINFVVGVAVLGAGLWVFGRDGKMATYAALVAGVGTSQWLIGRGWRGAR